MEFQLENFILGAIRVDFMIWDGLGLDLEVLGSCREVLGADLGSPGGSRAGLGSDLDALGGSQAVLGGSESSDIDPELAQLISILISRKSIENEPGKLTRIL